MAAPAEQHDRPGINVDEYKEPTFHGFPNLPLELRTLIWNDAIRTPRVITISRTTRMVQVAGTPYKLHQPCAMVGITDAYPPAVLHVNKESREFALKGYQYAFHGRLRRPIYFNFAADYLHFENGHAMPVFEYPRSRHNFGKCNKEETRQKIQRVIIGKPAFDRYESYGRSDSYAKSIKWSIGRYQALKVVIFQTPSEDFDESNTVPWRLSAILKPVMKKWGKYAPRTMVPVASEALSDMIEGVEINFEKAVYEEPVPVDWEGFKKQGNLLNGYLAGELLEHFDHPSDDSDEGESSDEE
ncbi:hypothetical protein DL98DRAFT_71869 [Cadophora sp. DSE1049]|nr:hypothetical protein DL98DRAFT_71869 [Cadophora sp. DSE1049]